MDMIIRSRTVVLPLDDIDTDQIIPGALPQDRPRREVTSASMPSPTGVTRTDGTPRQDFPLNLVDLAQHRILVAGPQVSVAALRASTRRGRCEWTSDSRR